MAKEPDEIVYLLYMYMMSEYNVERFEAEGDDTTCAPLGWTLRSVFGTLAKATEAARSSDIFEKFHPDFGEFVTRKEDTSLLESFWFKHAKKLGVEGFILRSFIVDLSFVHDALPLTEHFAIYAIPTVVQR